MRIAVVGSRSIEKVDLESYISGKVELVSGGAVGVDACAAAYAEKNGLPLKVFLPQYRRYGRGAPIVRNKEIVEYADKVLVFWDGRSKGTQSVIQYAHKIGKPCRVVLCES